MKTKNKTKIAPENITIPIICMLRHHFGEDFKSETTDDHSFIYRLMQYENKGRYEAYSEWYAKTFTKLGRVLE